MKTLPIIALVASSFLFGCIRTEVTNKGKDGSLVEIGFNTSAQIVPVKAAAGNSDLPVGTTAYIAAYATGVDIDNTATTLYSATAAGKHTATSYNTNKVELTAATMGDKIVLPADLTYDFYTVSPSSLTFGNTSGANISGILDNGQDYLWAKTTKAITEADKNVPLIYSHAGCMLTFNLEGDATNGVNSLEEVTSATITAPDPTGSLIRLKDGLIAPVSVVGSTVTIPAGCIINADAPAVVRRLQYPMLPITASSGGTPNVLQVAFTVKINGQGSSTTFPAATLAVPAAGFEAKKNYLYKVILRFGGISFQDPEVTDWVEVSGDDIIIEN